MIYEIIVGAVLAIIAVFIVRQIYPNKDHAFWRMGLIIAAVIYVGFLLFAKDAAYLFMELGGVLLYGTFAFLSKRYSLYWLSAGWILHIAWDVFLHSPSTTPFVPHWYAGACIGFDIIIALYIFWLAGKRTKLV